MKQILSSILVVLFLILVMTACSKKVEPIQDPNTNSTQIEPSRVVSADESSYPVLTEELLQGGVYISKNRDYQISFPESWKNYYFILDDIDEKGRSNLTVCFYGESKRGKYAYGTDQNGKEILECGFPIFFIVPYTADFLGSVECIGQVQEQKYYYATTTDYSLPSYLDSSALYFGTRLQDDPVEEAKYNNDVKKVLEMLDDIEEIKKSFKSLK